MGFTFGLVNTIEPTVGLVSLIMVVLFIVFFDYSIGITEYLLDGSPMFNIMIKAIYKELMLMGLVSFTIVTIQAAKEDLSTLEYDWIIGVDFAHILIFYMTIFFVLNALYLMAYAVYTSRFHRRAFCQKPQDLIKELRSTQQSTVRNCVFNWKYIPWPFPDGLKEKAEYSLMHHIFSDIYILPESFDFPSYLAGCFERYALKTINRSLLTWFVLILIAVVNQIRISSGLGCHVPAQNDDGNGGHRRVLIAEGIMRLYTGLVFPNLPEVVDGDADDHQHHLQTNNAEYGLDNSSIYARYSSSEYVASTTTAATALAAGAGAGAGATDDHGAAEVNQYSGGKFFVDDACEEQHALLFLFCAAGTVGYTFFMVFITRFYKIRLLNRIGFKGPQDYVEFLEFANDPKNKARNLNDVTVHSLLEDIEIEFDREEFVEDEEGFRYLGLKLVEAYQAVTELFNQLGWAVKLSLRSLFSLSPSSSLSSPSYAQAGGGKEAGQDQQKLEQQELEHGHGLEKRELSLLLTPPSSPFSSLPLPPSPSLSLRSTYQQHHQHHQHSTTATLSNSKINNINNKNSSVLEVQKAAFGDGNPVKSSASGSSKVIFTDNNYFSSSAMGGDGAIPAELALRHRLKRSNSGARASYIDLMQRLHQQQDEEKQHLEQQQQQQGQEGDIRGKGIGTDNNNNNNYNNNNNNHNNNNSSSSNHHHHLHHQLHPSHQPLGGGGGALSGRPVGGAEGDAIDRNGSFSATSSFSCSISADRDKDKSSMINNNTHSKSKSKSSNNNKNNRNSSSSLLVHPPLSGSLSTSGSGLSTADSTGKGGGKASESLRLAKEVSGKEAENGQASLIQASEFSLRHLRVEKEGEREYDYGKDSDDDETAESVGVATYAEYSEIGEYGERKVQEEGTASGGGGGEEEGGLTKQGSIEFAERLPKEELLAIQRQREKEILDRHRERLRRERELKEQEETEGEEEEDVFIDRKVPNRGAKSTKRGSFSKRDSWDGVNLEADGPRLEMYRTRSLSTAFEYSVIAKFQESKESKMSQNEQMMISRGELRSIRRHADLQQQLRVQQQQQRHRLSNHHEHAKTSSWRNGKDIEEDEEEEEEKEELFKSIFFFGKPELYFQAVELLVMFNCLYLALWATNFITIVHDSNELSSSEAALLQIFMVIPVLIVIPCIGIIAKTAAQLHAMSDLNLEVVHDVLKEMLDSEQLMRELRERILYRLSRAHTQHLLDISDHKTTIGALFRELDRDGSGSIDRQEFRSLLRKLKLTYSNKRFKLLFRALDSINGDGTIEEQELLAFLFPQYSTDLHTATATASVKAVALRRGEEGGAADTAVGDDGESSHLDENDPNLQGLRQRSAGWGTKNNKNNRWTPRSAGAYVHFFSAPSLFPSPSASPSNSSPTRDTINVYPSFSPPLRRNESGISDISDTPSTSASAPQGATHFPFSDKHTKMMTSKKESANSNSMNDLGVDVDVDPAGSLSHYQLQKQQQHGRGNRKAGDGALGGARGESLLITPPVSASNRRGSRPVSTSGKSSTGTPRSVTISVNSPDTGTGTGSSAGVAMGGVGGSSSLSLPRELSRTLSTSSQGKASAFNSYLAGDQSYDNLNV